MRGRPRSSLRVTAFGLVLIGLLMVGAFLTPVVADPEIAGIAWISLAAIVGLGIFWPVLSVLSVRAAVRSCPSDVVAGSDATAVLELRGLAGMIELRIVGGRQPWGTAEVPDTVEVPFAPHRRGCFETYDVDIRTSGPLGVLRARRRIALRLPHPVWVAPSPSMAEWSPQPTDEQMVEGRSSLAATLGDVVRSVRPYALGDPAHLVHWPSTARLGSVVVREMEPPAGIGVAIVVALGGGAEADEAAVSLAAGLVRSVRATGGLVALCTHGPAGPDTSTIRSTIEADRLLAVANPGPPGPPPPGWVVQVVR